MGPVTFAGMVKDAQEKPILYDRELTQAVSLGLARKAAWQAKHFRDLGKEGVATWPLYWMLVWSGTLGSNLTIAGAPALYVALTIAEKEEGRKVSLREFLSWSVAFTLVATVVTYVLGMLIWVLPYTK